jgi:3',5'-cyclic AMP phosphodiesterase CpdA
MPLLTLAHLSDLHFGLSQETERTAAALCRTLLSSRIDHVVVTGDVTHRGRRAELERFRQVFHPLLKTGRMTVVPGNHDRLGDDLTAEIAGGLRVSRVSAEGVSVVRVDSTAPHNRSWLASHGHLHADEVDQIEALLEPRRDVLNVVALHHHPLPLPEDSLTERLVTRLGSANGNELQLGPELVRRLCGRCDLLLHGHRHVPREVTLCGNEQPRPLRILNAGSSTELGAVRVFQHTRGRLAADPYWLSVPMERTRNPQRSRNAQTIWDAVRAIAVL